MLTEFATTSVCAQATSLPCNAAITCCRWPWILHHIAKEYRDSAQDHDTSVLAVNIIQVLEPEYSCHWPCLRHVMHKSARRALGALIQLRSQLTSHRTI